MCDSNRITSQEILNKINEKIYNRNIPSSILEPYFSLRPVSTKFQVFPVIDNNIECSVKLENYRNYNIEKIFNPGNNTAPWSGYSNNVNIESVLRNQFFALQRCNQSEYIPCSKSTLYNLDKLESINNLDKFTVDEFKEFNPNPNINIVGRNIFHNNTRQQIKSIE